MMIIAPIDAVVAALAANAGFQQLVNGNQSQAAARIYQNFLPDPADLNTHTLAELIAFRPFALVWTTEDNGWRAERNGAGNCFRFGGSIMIHLEWGIPANTSGQAASLTFQQHVSRILHNDSSNGILQTTDDINLQRVLLTAMYRSPVDVVDTYGDCYAAELRLDWGQR